MISYPSMYPLLTIGDVSRRSGVAASALHYYEQRGLVWSERSSAGHRRYHRAVLRRIAFIVFAQRVGLTLEEIAALLSTLPSDRAPSPEDWARLSEPWIGRVQQRITELERLKQSLVRCIGCGCLSVEHCHLANPGDRAASLGEGPRYWLGDQNAEGEVR